jgi:hypothetical protein
MDHSNPDVSVHDDNASLFGSGWERLKPQVVDLKQSTQVLQAHAAANHANHDVANAIQVFSSSSTSNCQPLVFSCQPINPNPSNSNSAVLYVCQVPLNYDFLLICFMLQSEANNDLSSPICICNPPH